MPKKGMGTLFNVSTFYYEKGYIHDIGTFHKTMVMLFPPATCALEANNWTSSNVQQNYCKSENIRVANFHVIKFCVKKVHKSSRERKFFNAKISYTSSWQHHFERLKTSSSMKEYCCNRGYHKYKVLTVLLTKVFMHDSLLHRRVCKAITCISTCQHVDNDRSGSGRPWPLVLFSLMYLQIYIASED